MPIYETLLLIYKKHELGRPSPQMHSAEDISRIDRLKAGDQSALKELYTLYFSALVKVATHLTGESIHSKDIVQNAFVQLWHKRASIQIEIAIFPYLRRMVINEVLAMQRKTERRTALWQKQREGITHHSDVEDALNEKELQTAIRAAIDKLPERCSEIFKLSRYSEMTYAEIAEALDISVKTVENQMGKALKVLRETLSEYL